MQRRFKVSSDGADEHRVSRRRQEAGFSLVELLVVMIVIGILSGIAAPVYLNSRHRAVDRATEADVTNLGLTIQSYFVDGARPLVYAQAAGERVVHLAADNASWQADVPVSAGSTVQAFTVTTSGSWCVAMDNSSGSNTVFRYTPSGLEPVTC